MFEIDIQLLSAHLSSGTTVILRNALLNRPLFCACFIIYFFSLIITIITVGFNADVNFYITLVSFIQKRH